MGYRMNDGWDHSSSSVHWVLPLILGILVVVGIVVVVLMLRRQGISTRPGQVTAGAISDPAVTTLRDRFARGEIDEAEYRTRMALLSDPTPPPA